MWPCTQFYTPEGLLVSDIWARRFSPATARYPAHFSQKNNNKDKPRMFGKRLFPLCDGEIWQNFEISNLVTQYTTGPAKTSTLKMTLFILSCFPPDRFSLEKAAKKGRQKLFPRDEKWSASSFAPLKYLLLTPSCSLTCVRNLIVIKKDIQRAI